MATIQEQLALTLTYLADEVRDGEYNNIDGGEFVEDDFEWAFGDLQAEVEAILRQFRNRKSHESKDV